jgi:hypothetical protein
VRREKLGEERIRGGGGRRRNYSFIVILNKPSKNFSESN